MAISLLLGIVVFFITVIAIGEGLIHDPIYGIFPGIVLAIWAAWSFFHYDKVSSSMLLHPVPRKYLATSAHAFRVIHNILSEGTYNYGNRWSIRLADWQTGRILAELSHFDPRTKIDVNANDSLSYPTTKKMELDPQVKLEAHITETEDRKTIVRIAFAAGQSAATIRIYESIVRSITSAIEAQLGPGLALGKGMSARLPNPPWWLLAVSIATLIYLFDTVVQALSG